jgi:hypothetical protein
MSDCRKELKSLVLGITNDLEAAVAGNLYHDGSEWLIINDLDEWKSEKYKELADEFRKEHPEEQFDGDEDLKSSYDSYEEYMEDEIGTVDDVDEPEEASLGKYIDDRSLGDLRFEVDGEKRLCGGRVLFCWGGPTVWVHDDRVCGYWGCDQEEMYLDGDVQSALFGWFEENWDMLV